MLADARFPAGGHAHSGGLEGAVNAGAVADVPSLNLYLQGRLATAGVVAAALAAAACARPRADRLARLDAEADARTPSPAQREASRRQGRTLLRAAAAAWPAWLADLPRDGRPPHHAIALGAAAAAAGCTPGEAALVAAYLTVTGPASAAVRLLALDPIEVSAAIARLAGRIEERRGARRSGGPLTTCPIPRRPRSTCTPRPTPERRCVSLHPDHDDHEHAHGHSHDGQRP